MLLPQPQLYYHFTIVYNSTNIIILLVFMRNALLPLFLLFNVSLAKREACLALLNQELMSRSIELLCIPVTAFS